MRIGFFILAAMAGILAAGHWVGADPQVKEPPVAEAPAREADKAAIVQSSKDFAAAFEKGDAKAVAALWTEQAEYESDDGTELRGRAAIEAAFAAHFKEHKPEKMEVKIESIRFPSRDTAIEEGLTRSVSAENLPGSAFYRVLHVREDGKWRMALSKEWGAAENRVGDLDWLVGGWQGKAADREVGLNFTRDPEHPFIVANFIAKDAGKSASTGTMKVGIDPITGRFKSWHFDADGGHGEGVWLRDGNHWVVDSHGVTANGAETAAVNILTRIGADEVSWRSIDRKVGGEALPDTLPIKLKRVAGK